MDSDNIELNRLIKLSYSGDDALKQSAYQATPDEMSEIGKVAKKILDAFPYLPNCCAPMSALLAGEVQRLIPSIPTYLVAGCLKLHEKQIFGDDTEIKNVTDPFSASNPSWNGHCWVVFGNIIGDISIFRTAYAPTAPEWLKKMVLKSFSEKTEFILGKSKFLQTLGLKYQPKNIATYDQITSLIKGAVQIIKERVIPVG